MKHHGKQRKSSMSMRAKDKYNSKLTGPKPFPLERLLAIFYNITEVSTIWDMNLEFARYLFLYFKISFVIMVFLLH